MKKKTSSINQTCALLPKMTSTNELEKRLLTRCYNSNEEILNILETRYSTEGEQKPTILFKHVKKPTKNNRKSILLKPSSDDKIPSSRKRSTRNELKQYITSTITNQRKLIKKIRAYKRANQPFSIEPLIKQYDIPKFEDFIKMNDLWQSYIQDLLGLDTNTPLNTSVMLPKLVNADFNGCLLTVLQSRNNNVVGTRGIVVWDCQHSFIMVVPRGEDYKEWTSAAANDKEVTKELDPAAFVGGMKIIPKQYTLFGFDVVLPSEKKHDNNERDIEVDDDDDDDDDESQEGVESIGFTLIGSRFEIRSVERSAKKFKNHAVDDLL